MKTAAESKSILFIVVVFKWFTNIGFSYFKWNASILSNALIIVFLTKIQESQFRF